MRSRPVLRGDGAVPAAVQRGDAARLVSVGPSTGTKTSVGTYTVAADCTGTLSITGGPTFNIYVGPGAQKVWTLETSPNPAGLGVSVGTAVRVPE